MEAIRDRAAMVAEFEPMIASWLDELGSADLVLRRLEDEGLTGRRRVVAGQVLLRLASAGGDRVAALQVATRWGASLG